MNISYDELRSIKHSLPTGSVSRIAEKLNIEEQTVRNYFGAQNYKEGSIINLNIEPGPGGGIVHLEDVSILHVAKSIIKERRTIAR